ncbi:MAG: hypothetical protein ACIAXF_17335, partial [Phycisphaerales bacterium JB063]
YVEKTCSIFNLSMSIAAVESVRMHSEEHRLRPIVEQVLSVKSEKETVFTPRLLLEINAIRGERLSEIEKIVRDVQNTANALERAAGLGHRLKSVNIHAIVSFLLLAGTVVLAGGVIRAS